MAIAAPRRRADGEEDRIGPLHRGAEVGGEGQPAVAHILGDQLVEPRLVDRHPPGMQAGDLVRVDIHHCHVNAEFGEARAGDKADITCADHGDAHLDPSLLGQSAMQ